MKLEVSFILLIKVGSFHFPYRINIILDIQPKKFSVGFIPLPFPVVNRLQNFSISNLIKSFIKVNHLIHDSIVCQLRVFHIFLLGLLQQPEYFQLQFLYLTKKTHQLYHPTYNMLVTLQNIGLMHFSRNNYHFSFYEFQTKCFQII